MSVNPETGQVTVDNTFSGQAKSLLLMLFRVVGISVSLIGVLATAFKTRDISGLVAWVQGDGIAQLAAAVSLIAFLGASVWVTIKKKWREIYLAYSARDEDAVLKQTPVEPPKPI